MAIVCMFFASWMMLFATLAAEEKAQVEPIQIGSRLELLVDRLLVDKVNGLLSSGFIIHSSCQSRNHRW